MPSPVGGFNALTFPLFEFTSHSADAGLETGGLGVDPARTGSPPLAVSRPDGSCVIGRIRTLRLFGNPKAQTQPPTTSPPSATGSAHPTAPGTAAVSPTPTPKPTPVYKPADANGPAQNVPLPVKPALADKFSKAGLEAFARYWYQTLSYAFESGDLKPLESVSEAGCIPCARTKTGITPWHQKGRWTVGGQMTVNGAQSTFETAPDGTHQVIASVSQGSISYYQADGTLVETHPSSRPITDILVATYANGQWSALTVEHLGGSS
ncbi:DUF6318 family protein [Paenarthrobacter sp. Z7-10]|uniref:DUF6318 family protein n=1 Tax=Paenarthrobacter sp. Z7-10 TaxID=2787635 RepID=UPI003FA7BED0